MLRARMSSGSSVHWIAVTPTCKSPTTIRAWAPCPRRPRSRPCRGGSHCRPDFVAGYGVLDNVAKAYGFIVDKYVPGDRIYLLGFSRGALTVRLIGGLLHRIGVLRPDAKNLIPYALELYGKHYTRMCDEDQRSQVRAVNADFRKYFSAKGDVNIRFLGVWDTVKAFGVFRPRSFPHLRHNPSIKTVRHAIALDERRLIVHVHQLGWAERLRRSKSSSEPGREGGVVCGRSPGRRRWISGARERRSWRSFRWMVGEARLAMP